jgi:hypothetical protein
LLIFKKRNGILEQQEQIHALLDSDVDWKPFGPRTFAEVLPPKQYGLSKVMGELVKQFGVTVMREELELVPARTQLLEALR